MPIFENYMTQLQLMSVMYIQIKAYMKQITFYSLKIKIISLHFRIRAIQGPLLFHLQMGDAIMDYKEITLRQGLLQQNVTMAFEVNEQQISKFKYVNIIILENNLNGRETVGNIIIPFQEFQNVKMRNFNISNCFDSSAHLQAFLVLMPSKIVQCSDEQQVLEQEESQFIISKIKNYPMIESFINIKYEEEEQDGLEDMTFNGCRRRKSVLSRDSMPNMIETQIINVESLVTLNDILSETNGRLQNQNQKLKKKVVQLQNKIVESNKSKAEEQLLQFKIKEYQCQLKILADQLQQAKMVVDQMAKDNTKLETLVEELRFSQTLNSQSSQIKKENKLDYIMFEMDKYKETVKKYKYKFQSRKSEWKLVSVPKIKTTKKDFPLRDLSNTQRVIKDKHSFSTRQHANYKQLANQKTLRLIDRTKVDETFDTLKSSTMLTR